MRAAIAGCGLIGHKRAQALRAGRDQLIGCTDLDAAAAARLAEQHGTRACGDLDELLALEPEVVIVAAVHDQLAALTARALAAGAHVLVEKPAGIGSAEVQRLIDLATGADRLVKVGFNHRFHGGIARAAAEVRSGEHGELLHVRARYGHGGRLGYEREWRAQPERSGGGELIDQGMHLLDIIHWLAGPLPLHSALLRTQFWDAPVEDNAALILGGAQGPWAMMHVSWTEWKNLFSLEICCAAAKLQVDGLVRSYGPQRLTIYRMAPELGPPAVQTLDYPDHDGSWDAEWEHFAAVIEQGGELLGSLHDALYAWSRVEDAYAAA